MRRLSDAQARALIQRRVWAHFTAWLKGQTVPVRKGRRGLTVPGVYAHDVERYLNAVLEGTPTYFD